MQARSINDVGQGQADGEINPPGEIANDGKRELVGTQPLLISTQPRRSHKVDHTSALKDPLSA